MLNRVILMGRIAQDLVIKQTQGGTPVLSFTVAVERSYVKQGEERQADFIDCVAWRQQAEFISKYFAKGRMIAIEGSLRKRVYEDKNSVKHYVTEVFVDSVSFTGEPKREGGYERSYSDSYSSDSRSSAPQGSYGNAALSANPTSNDTSIGSLADFEGVIGDDDAPF